MPVPAGTPVPTHIEAIFAPFGIELAQVVPREDVLPAFIAAHRALFSTTVDEEHHFESTTVFSDENELVFSGTAKIEGGSDEVSEYVPVESFLRFTGEFDADGKEDSVAASFGFNLPTKTNYDYYTFDQPSRSQATDPAELELLLELGTQALERMAGIISTNEVYPGREETPIDRWEITPLDKAGAKELILTGFGNNFQARILPPGLYFSEDEPLVQSLTDWTAVIVDKVDDEPAVGQITLEELRSLTPESMHPQLIEYTLSYIHRLRAMVWLSRIEGRYTQDSTGQLFLPGILLPGILVEVYKLNVAEFIEAFPLEAKKARGIRPV